MQDLCVDLKKEWTSPYTLLTVSGKGIRITWTMNGKVTSAYSKCTRFMGKHPEPPCTRPKGTYW